MTHLEQQLKEQIKGDTHFDSITRGVYSVDASIFEILPAGVVLPKTGEDLIRTVQIAAQNKTPVTVRGAATGITGGCLGEGLIIDTSKYLNRILEINIEKEYAICEPGVVQDELNAALAPYGYRLGPDTSTGNRATLGGMLANNAAGSRSLRYGTMADHILEVELVLSDGKVIRFDSLSEEMFLEKTRLPDQEGRIYQAVENVRSAYASEIDARFPKIPRRVSGYNLDKLLDSDKINLCQLIAGSEGTLGIVTRLKTRIVPMAKAAALCVIHFDHLIEAMNHIPLLSSFNPSAIEMIDRQIIELGRLSPSMRGKMSWLELSPEAIFIVELDGQSSQEVEQKAVQLARTLENKKIGYRRDIFTDAVKMNHIWTLRKAGLGILLSKRTYSRAIAFLEDITVPPAHLASFMTRFLAYLESKGKMAGIYGHVGSGCMHIRPYMDLRQEDELQLMQQMMRDVTSLLLDEGGSLSGEHGDGLIRSWLNPALFGKKVIEAFILIKQAFDPFNRMNPGKILASELPLDHLRLSPQSHLHAPKTFLNFEEEGGFGLAVDLCNGNGRCRKKEGVMCPSFQVTHDEYHSTRARAQTLRGIVHGHLKPETFSSQGLYDVLDLCLSCKGCKTECPSEIDMAKMKSEFLYHYQEKHGYPLRNYLFGYIGKLNKIMSTFPALFNWLNSRWLIKKGLNSIGIAFERQLPFLSSERFSKWFKEFAQPTSHKQVILFNDTFTEFNESEIGQAAILILNQLGYGVSVPDWQCCGRPLFSKGLLKQARRYAERVIESLIPFALENIPIIGLEPSCILMLKDDYKGLIDPSSPLFPFVEKIASRCFTFDEFLAHLIEKEEFNLPLETKEQTIQLHGHCHQKALVGTAATLKVLNALPGAQVFEIPSGCCGMAGSFGYEKEHYTISLQIGELALFPAIRKSTSDTITVADGVSCRSQIEDGTGRHAIHLAELVASYLKT